MELTPEQINEFISNAVLESQIGEAVKASVARVVADLNKTYNNPFDEVIKRYVVELVNSELRTTYKPQFEEKIKAALADWMTEDVFKRIIDAAIEKLGGRY